MMPCAGNVEEEESFYHILCQCLALAGHRMKLLASAWLKPTDISMASIEKVLALSLRTRVF
jgi:hypothetical protein